MLWMRSYSVRQAYEFLELTPPVTMEQVRKQWKRLSLRYHPDRNQGSEESHAMQQRLNEAMNRVQEAIEETSSSSSSSHSNSNDNDNDNDNDPQDESTSQRDEHEHEHEHEHENDTTNK
jgi:curved DNA-binding protein CbpA